MSKQKVFIVNPLGAALHHYTNELADVLTGAGHPVQIDSIREPSASGGTKLSWGIAYVRLLARSTRWARQGNGRVIVVWPIAGFLDLALAGLLTRRNQLSIVIHDPVPLVRSLGYGKCAQLLARVLRGSNRIISHSEQGVIDIWNPSLRCASTLLPHPMLPPRLAGEDLAIGERVVRVLGQYKPDRDLDAMRDIASIKLTNVRFEAIGRGWPSIAGWQVRDEFVSEAEMDSLIASADCVVIPYRRFYQSGVAIRAMEKCTPVVGPKMTSLDDLLGSASPLLVDPSQSWTAAVRFALDAGRSSMLQTASTWHRRVVAEWTAWGAETRQYNATTPNAQQSIA